MSQDHKKCWEELNRSISKMWKEKGTVFEHTKYFKICFFKPDEEILSIVTDEIDNEYDKEFHHRWEICLHKDGTWTIE